MLGLHLFVFRATAIRVHAVLSLVFFGTLVLSICIAWPFSRPHVCAFLLSYLLPLPFLSQSGVVTARRGIKMILIYS